MGAADRVSTAVREICDHTAASALAVAAAAGHARAFAGRGLLLGAPVDPDTVFYGASLAKQVIGLLVASTLARSGGCADDPIRTLLPAPPGPLDRVRIRHLVHHTSGLPDATEPHPELMTGNAQVLERLLGSQPEAPAGAGFRYNNSGYVLLAEAVARAWRRPAGELADSSIFAPLGMGSSRFGGTPIVLPGEPGPPGTIGDGGLWTTASDLLSWLTALNERTAGRALVEQLETPGALDDGTALDYGWGVRVRPTPAGVRVTHGGSWGSWLATTVRLPSRGVAVAVLSTGGTETGIRDAGLELADRLAEISR